MFPSGRITILSFSLIQEKRFIGNVSVGSLQKVPENEDTKVYFTEGIEYNVNLQ